MGWVLSDMKEPVLPGYFVNHNVGIVVVAKNVFGADKQMQAEICKGGA